MIRSRCTITLAVAATVLVVVPLAAAEPTTGPASKVAWDARGPWTVSTQEAKAAADRNEQLGRMLATADDHPPLVAARLHLSWCNQQLARTAQTSASRWITGLASEDDLKNLAGAAQQARDDIAKARSYLDRSAKADRDGKHKADRLRLKNAANTLDALADIYASAQPSQNEDAKKRLHRAAIRLSAARESDDANLASAAMLWRAVAWYQAKRSQRAMATLPDALTSSGNNSYDFFARLLRCRVLTDSDQHAVALMLAYRLEAKCKKWTDDRPFDELERRHRLLRLLQWEITRNWLAQLRAAGETAAVAQLESALAQTRKTIDSDSDRFDVYQLELAFPIIVEPPPDLVKKSALSQPASAPSSAHSQGR